MASSSAAISMDQSPPFGDYHSFLLQRSQIEPSDSVRVAFMPEAAFDFQRYLIEWSLQKGRAAILADCGLGKTLMQLAWAENIRRKTGGNVLILTPLAVSRQTVGEAAKFGVECVRSADGGGNGIVVTNYERLHYFDPGRFSGVVCDESSILKSFDGSTRKAITLFMRGIPYRLLCTATAAPNDHIEFGTSSEALGYLGYTDMLTRFFKNDEQSLSQKRSMQSRVYETKWRFKGHAEQPFWRWLGSWARALRKPSDVGFADDRFDLPALTETQHKVIRTKAREGMLFDLPAVGLREQREERRESLTERCEKVAELVDHDKPALVWCNLNDEGNALERLIPGSVQVSGSDSDDSKEEHFAAFLSGEARVLITKPKIGAWGLNFQHCAHTVMFPSHSFEQYYQCIRRVWRFGQTRPVQVDIVTTNREVDILGNLHRKCKQADEQFEKVIAAMRQAAGIAAVSKFSKTLEVPQWL